MTSLVQALLEPAFATDGTTPDDDGCADPSRALTPRAPCVYFVHTLTTLGAVFVAWRGGWAGYLWWTEPC